MEGFGERRDSTGCFVPASVHFHMLYTAGEEQWMSSLPVTTLS